MVDQQDKALNLINSVLSSTNFVEQVDEDEAIKLGHDVCQWYEIDRNSRQEWEEKYEDYIRLASQVHDKKSFPWPKAANVKYPLLTIAAMQFAARSYQALVPSGKVVKARVIGEDPDGKKLDRAHRIANYMSYQILEEMPAWEDAMDRLCLVLPIIGNVFKKTYYDGENMVSELVLPKDLVVNYYAKSVEEASRKTHVLYFYPNEIEEKIRSGEFIEFDYIETNQPDESVHTYVEDEIYGLSEATDDPDMPQKFLECHCWYDLDDDGYKEPYIITVHKDTKTPVRMVARYDADGVEKDEENNIIRIKPVEYFTNFVFIPDPNSGIYGLGFGVLLGPLNEAANTLINQLIDSGSLSNLQSGFLAKGVRVPHGETPLKPGEWRHVNTIGDDLKKGIVPLPTNEPSQVLFELLGLMLSSGQKLSAVSDIMMGENPGQNQPFSTTQTVLNQGQQVFSSIHKRIHSSLKKEFKKLYRLNRLYLPQTKYFAVLDPSGPEDQSAAISSEDFANNDMDVTPASNPRQDSEAVELNKIQTLMSLMQLGTINPKEVTKRVLEIQNHENIDKLMMNTPADKPNFDQQIKLQELQLKAGDQEINKIKTQYQAARDEAAAAKTAAEAQQIAGEKAFEQLKMKFDAEMKQFESMMQQQKHEMEMQKETMKMMQEHQKMQMGIRDQAQKEVQKDKEQKQKERFKEEEHQQKMKHKEEDAKAKRNAKDNTSS